MQRNTHTHIYLSKFKIYVAEERERGGKVSLQRCWLNHANHQREACLERSDSTLLEHICPGEELDRSKEVEGRGSSSGSRGKTASQETGGKRHESSSWGGFHGMAWEMPC